MQSLDPRINRLHLPDYQDDMPAKKQLDQFATYEVFQQFKEGKPYEHVGSVHAPNEDMGFLFAKEQYTRRGTGCTGMFIIRTDAIQVSIFTDGNDNVLDTLHIDTQADTANSEAYEIFYLKKRGKQHIHAGTVQAASYAAAASEAAQLYAANPCVNVWLSKQNDILFSLPEDKDIWNTLADKKYRDAIAYRSQDKINKYKAAQQV